MIGQQSAQSPYEKQRLGCFTSSEIDVLFGCGTRPMTEDELKNREKGNKRKTVDDPTILTEGAMTYIKTKMTELLTGTTRVMDGIYALEYGDQTEPLAIAELEKEYPGIVHYGNTDRKFFPLTRLSGGSPDAVHENTVFEIKCPENPKNHLDFLLLSTQEELKKAEPKYYHQLQMNMICVSRALNVPYEEMKGLFVSYSPLFDAPLHLKKIEVLPEAGFEKMLLETIKKAETKIVELKNKLAI